MKLTTIYWLSSMLAASTFLNACKDKDTKTETPVVLSATSSSGEATASFNSGLASFDLGDNLQARAMFIKAIEQDPKLAIAYVFKATTDVGAKEFADDLNKAKENLGSAGEWEKLYCDYVSTFLTSDWNKRLEISQKMATSFPKAARAQVDLGNTYLNGSQDDKARAAYAKAIELDPNWAGGYSALVNSYLFSDPKDFKKAEENALKVVSLAPKSPAAEIALGDCYRAENDLQKARDAYAKAIELNPNDPAAYYKKGHANSFLGNYDEARQNYMDGSKHDEALFGYVASTGNSYLYAGDAKQAITYLMGEYAKMDGAAGPKDKITAAKVNCLESCANIAIHTGDASKLKELATLLDPLYTEVAGDIGTAEAKMTEKALLAYWQGMAAALQGDYNGANAKAEEIKTALASVTDPNKLTNYEMLMGSISMKQKNYSDAIAHFEKAQPTVFMYNKFCLAMANEEAGNKDKAMASYKELATYNFNDVGYAMIRAEARKKAGTP
jgi:tetratricopeptide (TPR) repeat protein